MKLYFFPALLPLASVIPALLTAAGAVATILYAITRRKKLALLIFTSGLIGVAIFVMISQPKRPEGLPNISEVEALPKQNTSDAWRQLLPRAPLSNLAISKKHRLLIFGTFQKTLDAVSQSDGTLVFSLRFNEPIVSEPLVAPLSEDLVFVGEGLHDARSARVTAIQLPNGIPMWQHTFQGHIESKPTLSEDQKMLWGCAGDAGIFSLRVDNGVLLWRSVLGHCDTTPLIAGKLLYTLVGNSKDRSHLIALESETGKELWKTELPGDPWGTPALDPTTGWIIATTGRGQMIAARQDNEAGWAHAISPQNHKVQWTRRLDGLPLVISDRFTHSMGGLALITLKKGDVLALGTKTGETLWTLHLPAPALSAARLIPQTPTRGFVLAFDGTLIEFESASGRILSKRKINEQSYSAPAFSSDYAYFGTRAALVALPINEGNSR